MVLCGILDQGDAGVLIGQPTVLDYWVKSFFPQFFITSCNVFFTSTTLVHFFTVGLMLFPFVLGKILHVCGHSVPFFIVFSAISFHYGFSWVVHLSKCTGVYITTICFGTLLWTFFPSFPSQAVKCYFIKY